MNNSNKQQHKKKTLVTTNGRNNGTKFTVSEIDYKQIKDWKFTFSGNRIGVCNYSIFKHTSDDRDAWLVRFLINIPTGFCVYYMDKNPRNLCRENLVLVPMGRNYLNFKPEFATKPKFRSNLNSLIREQPTPNKLLPSPIKMLKRPKCLKVTLYNRKTEIVGYAYASIEDYDKLVGKRWHLEANGYAAHKIPCSCKRPITMHSLIMGNKEGMVIDHQNQNKLDNRRSNLRYLTGPQNSKNITRKSSSGYPGIRRKLYKDKEFYIMVLHINGDIIYHQFISLMAAGAARNYYLEKFKDNCHKRIDLKQIQKETGEEIIKISNIYQLTKYIDTHRKTKLGLYGVYIYDGRKFYLACGFRLPNTRPIYIKVAYGKDTLENRIKLAYLYNLAAKRVMSQIDRFLPLNDMRDYCTSNGVSYKEYKEITKDLELSEKTKETIDSLHNWNFCKFNILKPKNKNEIFVQMFSRQNRNFYIISLIDLDRIMKYSWYVDRTGYVKCTVHRTFMLLHRYIFCLTQDDVHVVHHKNHVKWDNRRFNLELITTQENTSKSHQSSKEERNQNEKELIKYIKGCKIIATEKNYEERKDQLF